MIELRKDDAHSRRLEGYLHDQLSELIRGTHLVRLASENNKDSTYGSMLRRLHQKSEEDVQTLRVVLSAFAYLEHAPVRESVAWLAEKVRLKRCEFSEYTSLARVMEMAEVLAVIDAKERLWSALQYLQQAEICIARFNFSKMIHQVREQRDQVRELHQQALRECFIDQRDAAVAP